MERTEKIRVVLDTKTEIMTGSVSGLPDVDWQNS